MGGKNKRTKNNKQEGSKKNKRGRERKDKHSNCTSAKSVKHFFHKSYDYRY